MANNKKIKSTINKSTLSEEYYFQEGCYILEMSNTPNDPDVSIARARVASGKTTRWHRLKNITERYVILEGNGFVEIGEELAKPVVAGDTIIIPPYCPQRIKNTGTTDLIFLAICSPRFLEEAYEDIEEEFKE